MKEFFLRIATRPNARISRIVEKMADGTWKVDVAAAPEDGKANAALIELLAEYFHLPKSSVELLSGHAGRHKRIKITQKTAQQVPAETPGETAAPRARRRR